MKTSTKNGITCASLKLIPYSNGWLAVDEEATPKENTNTFKQGINGDWYYNATHKFVAQIGDITSADFKIIAASTSLNLPVLRLPEREDSYEVIKEAAEKYGMWGGYAMKDFTPFRIGWNSHAATHGYTEQDMRKAFEAGRTREYDVCYGSIPTKALDIEDFLTSLRPQMCWCEVIEKEDWRGEPLEFKSRDGELVVVEWE